MGNILSLNKFIEKDYEYNRDKKVIQDDLIYVFNEDEKIAGIIGNCLAFDAVYIHHSITYDSKEFILKGILENSFKYSSKIKTIEFPSNSEVQIIEKQAFQESSLNFISIPSLFE